MSLRKSGKVWNFEMENMASDEKALNAKKKKAIKED